MRIEELGVRNSLLILFISHFTLLNHFNSRTLCKALEGLEDVDLVRAGGEALFPEHGAERIAAGNGLNYACGDVFIEAGNQGVADIKVMVARRIGMDGAAVDRLAMIGQRQRQAPIEQAAKQQVEVCAVGLDVGFHVVQAELVILVGAVENVGHVGVSELEDTEAGIEIRIATISMLKHA